MPLRLGILRASEELPSTHKYLYSFLTFAMVFIAVAGGTGVFGRNVLDFVAKAGEHKDIVLSRTVSWPMLSLSCNNIISPIIRQQPATTTDKPRHFAVDYNSVEQMRHVFQEKTSKLLYQPCFWLKKALQSQINLIKNRDSTHSQRILY